MSQQAAEPNHDSRFEPPQSKQRRDAASCCASLTPRPVVSNAPLPSVRGEPAANMAAVLLALDSCFAHNAMSVRVSQEGAEWCLMWWTVISSSRPPL